MQNAIYNKATKCFASITESSKYEERIEKLVVEALKNLKDDFSRIRFVESLLWYASYAAKEVHNSNKDRVLQDDVKIIAALDKYLMTGHSKELK